MYPTDTLMRFGPLDARLRELIGELDGVPCRPVEVGNIEPWLSGLRPESER